MSHALCVSCSLGYFLLLPAGNLGALRPRHPAILFSFDPASKAALKRMDVFGEFNSQPQVLYEYVPSQGQGLILTVLVGT